MKRLGLLLLVLFVPLFTVPSAGADVAFQATALPPAATTVRDVAVGDLDGKNGPDIVSSYAQGGIAVQLNDGSGHFGAAQLYPTPCDTLQVELADLGASNTGNSLDGHLDAAIVCGGYLGGEGKYLGRLTGDGNGGFGEARIVTSLSFGSFNPDGPQSMALTDERGPGLPPLPAYSYAYHSGSEYGRLLCFTYDWVNPSCLSADDPQPGPFPFLAGRIADAYLFTSGGTKGILDWGPEPNWHASTREIAKPPASTGENYYSLAVGDLAADGPDLISAAGTCGCGYQDSPASGVVNVLYGDIATGVPDQVGTKFDSAPGVTNIALGDFDLDGKNDLVGSSWSYSPADGAVGSVFVQSGDGAGHLGAPQMIPLYHGETRSTAPVRVADLDGNGSPDVVAIVGGQVQVLLNQKVPPPPAPAAQAPPAPDPVAAANLLAGFLTVHKGVILEKKGYISLGTATNPPTASVDLTVTLPGGAGTKARAATAESSAAKKKATLLGHTKITIPAGSKRVLKVKLKPKALALLKKGPIHARVVAVAVGVEGRRQSKSQALTIKPRKAARKKRHTS
ncbi:MAG TPA: VCBS repeat-containing protein [Solirubrobacterales bacterium]|nr:VCBS repeat-containing protein [Solirubrobacterales bacterium]